MAHFPEWIDRDEAAQINKTLSRILQHPEGLEMRAFDGEEYATEWTRDRAAIQRQTAQTDMTSIEVARYRADDSRERLGRIMFIHGNGEDVLSDAAWDSRITDAEQILADLTDAGNA